MIQVSGMKRHHRPGACVDSFNPPLGAQKDVLDHAVSGMPAKNIVNYGMNTTIFCKKLTGVSKLE